MLIRVKKILEQLSRARFFPGFEIPALFPLLRSISEKKREGISNPVKNRVLKSCLFPSDMYLKFFVGWFVHFPLIALFSVVNL